MFFRWAFMHEYPLILSGWNNTHLITFTAMAALALMQHFLCLLETIWTQRKKSTKQAWKEWFSLKHLGDTSESFRGNKLIEFSRILSRLIPWTLVNWKIVLLVFVLHVFTETPREGPVSWPSKLSKTREINLYRNTD